MLKLDPKAFMSNKFDIKKYLGEDKKILVISSRPLDLDCLGSGLIMKKYLESLGKNVTLIFPSKINEEEKRFHEFLPYFDEIEFHDTREILKNKNFDLLVLLDGSNIVQFYDTSETEDNPPDLNIYAQRLHIDHHIPRKEALGTYVIQKPLSSTAEVILEEVVPKDFIDENIATLGYGAIAGDSGNFRWNFQPQTMKLASLLIERGARVEEVVERLFFSKSKSYLKMTSFAIENAQFYDNVKTVFLSLPYERAVKEGMDSEQLPAMQTVFSMEVAKVVEGYHRGFMLYEEKKGEVLISAWGSNLRNTVNLPEFFTNLGANGGGHFNACGFKILGDFEEVKNLIITTLERRLRQTPGRIHL